MLEIRYSMRPLDLVPVGLIRGVDAGSQILVLVEA